MTLRGQVLALVIGAGLILPLCCTFDAKRVDTTTYAQMMFNASRRTQSKPVTHLGKQFVLMPPHSSDVKQGKTLEIIINAMENNTTVKLRMPQGRYKKIHLEKDREFRINVSKEVSVIKQAGNVQNGIGLTSSKDIFVHALYKESSTLRSEKFTENKFLIFPTRALSREYLLTPHPRFHSDFAIVGAYNNTNITIVMRLRSNRRGREYKREEKLSFVLNELETFRMAGKLDWKSAQVIAHKHIAVFSGISSGSAGIEGNCGETIEQVPGVTTWDQEYVVFGGLRHSSGGEILRVTSAYENTEINLEAGVRLTLGKYQFIDQLVTESQPKVITCFPSCMVTLITSGQGGKCHLASTMLNLPATKQFRPHYKVFVPDTKNRKHVFKVVIQCKARDGLLLNALVPEDLNWEISEDGTWCGAMVRVIKHGVNSLYHTDKTTKFGLVVMEKDGENTDVYLAGRGFDGAWNERNAFQGTITPSLKLAAKMTQTRKLKRYKSATIALVVICALMLFVLLSLLLHRKSKSLVKKREDTAAPAKLPAESEYQSIRGLPRRTAETSFGYEEVKPKLPKKAHTRPSLTSLLPKNDTDKDYENLKLNVRDSNPYVPMDEALPETGVTVNMLTGSGLARSGLTGSAIVLSSQEDIYLTMKRLIKAPQEISVEMGNL